MLRNYQRSFLSLAGAVLVVLAGLLFTGSIDGFSAMPGQAKPSKEKETAMFPHMDAAIGLLQAARGELQKAAPVFHGHREAAVEHVNKAIADLQKGINEFLAAHHDAARNEVIPAAPPAEAGEQYPHMRGALRLLQQAQVHLNEGAKVYHGERVAGLDETRAAIAEIEAGLKSAPTHK